MLVVFCALRAKIISMQEYRAYAISSDGQIKQRIDLFRANDEAATERAKVLVDGHDVELWRLERKVAEFKAKH
jgi:hypothetical protein